MDVGAAVGRIQRAESDDGDPLLSNKLDARILQIAQREALAAASGAVRLLSEQTAAKYIPRTEGEALLGVARAALEHNLRAGMHLVNALTDDLFDFCENPAPDADLRGTSIKGSPLFAGSLIPAIVREFEDGGAPSGKHTGHWSDVLFS